MSGQIKKKNIYIYVGKFQGVVLVKNPEICD